MKRPRLSRAYSFLWITLSLFVISWVGQWIFGLLEAKNEAAMHQESFQMSQYWVSFLQSTLENWQSEFLQLCWQAAGLAFLLYWGSSQSREGDDRMEAKIDALLQERGIDPEGLNTRIIKQFDGGS